MSALDWTRDGADWPNRAQSRFVEAAGFRWHVQQEGEGTDILLVHGTGASTHSWRNLWPLLKARGRLTAMDLPGHAFTTRQADLSLNGMAGAVAGLIGALGLRPSVLIGHSAGAAVATRLVLDGVAAPRLLVGIGPALEPFPGAAGFLFPALARMLLLNPLAPQLFAMTAGLPGETRRFLARSTGSRIDAEGARLYGRLFRNRAHVAATLAMMAAWDLAPLARGLAGLRTPLMLLHGAGDEAVPPRVSTEAAKLVPGARAIILPGLGHLPHEEDAAATAAPLLEALAERESA